VVARATKGMGEKEHYFGVDLLRFFAALLVVLNHFGIFAWNAPTMASTARSIAFPALVPASWFGWVGVEIFFVISGFVIAASAQHATASNFVKNRIIRVAPALWICSTLALVVQLTSNQPIDALFAAYVRSLVLSPIGPYIDGIVWTLVVEAAFYFLIFMTLLAGQFGRINRIAAALGAASAAFLILFACAEYFHNIPVFANIAAVCGRFYFKLTLLRYGVFFACGILLWYGFEGGFDRLTSALIAVFITFGAAEIMIQSAEIDHVTLLRSEPGAWFPPLVGRAMFTMCIWLGGVAGLVLSVKFKSKIYSRLKIHSSFLRKVGLLTYPLYLNHFVLGMTLVPALFALGLGRALVFALSFATVFGSSWFIMSVPERALQTTLFSFSSRSSKVA
jgi:peptidoglycan/LPS O-acetylase OafA/YrhL